MNGSKKSVIEKELFYMKKNFRKSPLAELLPYVLQTILALFVASLSLLVTLLAFSSTLSWDDLKLS